MKVQTIIHKQIGAKAPLQSSRRFSGVQEYLRLFCCEETTPDKKQPIPLELIHRHEDAILALLNPQFRSYYDLRYRHQRSYRQIAEYLNISEPLARKRVWRVREFIKDYFEQKMS